MYHRLDELLRHAKDCAKIGYVPGAETYIAQAAQYCTKMGVRIKPAFEKGIVAKARKINRDMNGNFEELEKFYSKRI